MHTHAQFGRECGQFGRMRGGSVFLYDGLCVSIKLDGKACNNVSADWLKKKNCRKLPTGGSPDLSSSFISTTSVPHRLGTIALFQPYSSFFRPRPI